MADNTFRVEVLPDGKIKATSEGGFRQSIHEDADKFLEYLNSLAGGAVETKKLPRTLANPQQQKPGQGQQHRH